MITIKSCIGASLQLKAVTGSVRFNSTLISSSLRPFLKKHNIEIKESDFVDDIQEPLISHLRKRGLIELTTHDEIADDVENRKVGLYCGADPSARSLHLGNLLPLMVLLHFNLRGHTINPLVGGATGEVGDPSGRTTERDQMADETRLTNVERISEQMRTFFKNGVEYASSRNSKVDKKNIGEQVLRNNRDWWKNMGMLEFLAKYGRHIRVNQMLARDSVKNRLSSEQGIGFNEFTYQILQAFDFYHLNKNHAVDIQVGGNDQYGNIVAGLDLISRLKNTEESNSNLKKSYGITVPLLTTSSGVKFGKSAGNAIFIDKTLTSSYNIYQFMFNSADSDVQSFLYKFSLLPTKVIDKVITQHEKDKKARFAQKVLAIEMCDLIHGDGEGLENLIISEIMFSKNADIGDYSADQILSSFRNQNMVKTIKSEELKDTNVTNILFNITERSKSKGEYKRLIQGGSVSVGPSKRKVTSPDEFIDTSNDLIEGKLLLIKVGKQYHIIEVLN